MPAVEIPRFDPVSDSEYLPGITHTADGLGERALELLVELGVVEVELHGRSLPVTNTHRNPSLVPPRPRLSRRQK